MSKSNKILFNNLILATLISYTFIVFLFSILWHHLKMCISLTEISSFKMSSSATFSLNLPKTHQENLSIPFSMQQVCCTYFFPFLILAMLIYNKSLSQIIMTKQDLSFLLFVYLEKQHLL